MQAVEADNTGRRSQLGQVFVGGSWTRIPLPCRLSLLIREMGIIPPNKVVMIKQFSKGPQVREWIIDHNSTSHITFGSRGRTASHPGPQSLSYRTIPPFLRDCSPQPHCWNTGCVC